MSRSKLVVRQAWLEQLAFWRNPQSAFFTFALPIGLLLIFGATVGSDEVPERPELSALTFHVPGILAFAIVVAAYANFAATLAILRTEGMLKRIRATPLTTGTYLAGHLTSVLATSLLLAASTIALGLVVFDVAPRAIAVSGLAATLTLGIICFAALGGAVSSFIPSANAASAITNGTYVPLALVSGTFDTSLRLPGWLAEIVNALPVKALTDALRAAYDPAAAPWPAGDLAVLATWSVVGIALACRHFRWEPA